MTPSDFKMMMLLGMVCGHINNAQPLQSHSVYSQWDELEMTLQQSCLKTTQRQKFIKRYTLAEFEQWSY